MNLLLDTHAFVWWDSSSDRLSRRAYALLVDLRNSLFLSVASAWEMQIKIQLGKLELRQPLDQLIADQGQANRIHVLPVMLNHIHELGKLPLHHKDPFDRLLAAVARAENMAVVSHDPVLKKYPINIAW